MPISTPPPPTAADCRCHCGSLLARVVEAGVELKCRRCKRTHVIPWEHVEPPQAEAASPASRPRAPARRRPRTPWPAALDEHS